MKIFLVSLFFLPLITHHDQYIAAVSLALGQPESNVFMSYNFEANYALPTQSTDFTQGLYDKILFINGVIKNETEARLWRQKFFSRQYVYEMIEEKLEDNGINGKSCLLRLICEVGSADLQGTNGVIGSIVHILLTPSTSENEAQMTDYLDAENSFTDCSKYQADCNISVCSLIENYQKDQRITKRGLGWPWLIYPLNAATGILVAIAIPLHDLDRNVFMSYNFEANYNMLGQASDSVPGPPYVRWKLGSTYEDMSVNPAGDTSPDETIARKFETGTNETLHMDDKNEAPIESNEADHDIQKRHLLNKIMLTRKGVYRALESRMSANGLDGKKCLLRAICESAMNPLLEVNGVLGHLLHIILTPSTSLDENLPSEYNKAENFGYQNNCAKYIQKCTFSLLDAVTTLI